MRTNLAPVDDVHKQATVLLRAAHSKLIRHKETRWLTEVIYLGKNEMVTMDDNPLAPTAWTDGINKVYVAEFVCSQPSVRHVTGLVLHENLHIGLRHIPRTVPMADRRLANQAADFVANSIIVEMGVKHPDFIALPPGGLYDPKFYGWSYPEIYRFLLAEQESQQSGKPQPQPGQGFPQAGNGPPAPPDSKRRGDTLDTHDTSAEESLSEEQAEELGDKVREALQRGAMLAGAMGVDMPQAITAGMQPDVDWTAVVTDWLTSVMKGDDEYTYARFDRRMIPFGVYLPGTETERLGAGLVSFDTSGSTTGDEINKFAANAQQLLEQFPPEELRVLWWDTAVRSEQMFTPETYANFMDMLQPRGGGGTEVRCVDQYMREHALRPDFHVIMTDGYDRESDITWHGDRSIPTLWIVTLNPSFRPPFGQMVFTGKH